MADLLDELSPRVSTTGGDLKQTLPTSRFPLPSPFLRSLVGVLSVGDDGGRRSDNSPAFHGFKCKWAPIDFGTDSARCPRALNLLAGRSFSALSGSSLDPPACPPDTPGCICTKSRASVAERRSSGGDLNEDISWILDVPQFEIDSSIRASPRNGIEVGATVAICIPSGCSDAKGAIECSKFGGDKSGGRSPKSSHVVSLDECSVAETETGDANRNKLAPAEGFGTVHINCNEAVTGMENSRIGDNCNGLAPTEGLEDDREGDEHLTRTGKSHTGDVVGDPLPPRDENGSRLRPAERLQDVGDMGDYDDVGLLGASLFIDVEREQRDHKYSKLVSSDATPSSAGLEVLDTPILDNPLTESTILVQNVELEEGEISDDELQVSDESCDGSSEMNSSNKTSFPVSGSRIHADSGGTKGNSHEASSIAEPLFRVAAVQPASNLGADCALENEEGNEDSNRMKQAEVNAPLPLERTSDENSAIISETSGKETETRNKKRKRGPITEQGKAKRKEKKKRKRAEENKKLGVKRLKLPISMPKPKPVVQCRFYLHGQCRQGKDCKFSHDAIPLTKSQPCKYYASQSQPCLKGDACPYDHDLSKYPCHSFVIKGSCVRGDKCLFSHKLPDGEDASATLKQNCMEYLQKLTEKSSIKKLSTCSNKEAPAVPSNSSKAVGRGSKVEKQQKQSEKPLMLPSKPPEGISFFSFENSAVKDTTMPQLSDTKLPKQSSASSTEDLTMSTKQSPNQWQPRSLVETPSSSKGSFFSLQPPSRLTEKEFKNVPSLASKAISNAVAFAAKYESEVMRKSVATSGSLSTSKSSSCVDSSTKPPVDGSTGRPKSATIILEEFLFGFANK